MVEGEEEGLGVPLHSCRGGRRRGDELPRARAQARPEHGGQGDGVAWLALPGGGDGRRGSESVKGRPSRVLDMIYIG